MAKWIRLTTDPTPRPVFINLDRVGLMQALPEHGTTVKFDDDFSLPVHETPEEILCLCDTPLSK